MRNMHDLGCYLRRLMEHGFIGNKRVKTNVKIVKNLLLLKLLSEKYHYIHKIHILNSHLDHFFKFRS